MRRTITTTLILSALLAAPAFAQHAGTKPDAQSDSTITQLVGTWIGAVYTDHAPETALRMTFVRGETFKLTVSILANDQEFVTGAATDLKVEGKSVSWNFALMEQACKGTGVLIGSALKGDFTCGDHGGTYLARKK